MPREHARQIYEANALREQSERTSTTSFSDPASSEASYENFGTEDFQTWTDQTIAYDSEVFETPSEPVAAPTEDFSKQDDLHFIAPSFSFSEDPSQHYPTDNKVVEGYPQREDSLLPLQDHAEVGSWQESGHREDDRSSGKGKQDFEQEYGKHDSEPPQPQTIPSSLPPDAGPENDSRHPVVLTREEAARYEQEFLDTRQTFRSYSDVVPEQVAQAYKEASDRYFDMQWGIARGAIVISDAPKQHSEHPCRPSPESDSPHDRPVSSEEPKDRYTGRHGGGEPHSSHFDSKPADRSYTPSHGSGRETSSGRDEQSKPVLSHPTPFPAGTTSQGPSSGQGSGTIPLGSDGRTIVPNGSLGGAGSTGSGIPRVTAQNTQTGDAPTPRSAASLKKPPKSPVDYSPLSFKDERFRALKRLGHQIGDGSVRIGSMVKFQLEQMASSEESGTARSITTTSRTMGDAIIALDLIVKGSGEKDAAKVWSQYVAGENGKKAKGIDKQVVAEFGKIDLKHIDERLKETLTERDLIKMRKKFGTAADLTIAEAVGSRNGQIGNRYVFVGGKVDVRVAEGKIGSLRTQSTNLKAEIQRLKAKGSALTAAERQQLLDLMAKKKKVDDLFRKTVGATNVRHQQEQLYRQINAMSPKKLQKELKKLESQIKKGFQLNPLQKMQYKAMKERNALLNMQSLSEA